MNSCLNSFYSVWNSSSATCFYGLVWFSSVLFSSVWFVLFFFFFLVVQYFSLDICFYPNSIYKGKFTQELKHVSSTMCSLQHPRTHLSYALWHTSHFMSWGTTKRQQSNLLANALTLNCAFFRVDVFEWVKYNISSYRCLMSNEVLLWLICIIVTCMMILLRSQVLSFFFFFFWAWYKLTAINQHKHSKIFIWKV